MGIEEKVSEINGVLDLMERIDNLAGRGVISPARSKVAREKFEEYMETVFPLPPPET